MKLRPLIYRTLFVLCGGGAIGARHTSHVTRYKILVNSETMLSSIYVPGISLKYTTATPFEVHIGLIFQ